ncbi:hypothetical protein PROFUN_03424 [Planoprotostelium fungivorum]|uniref:Uncharacterized protein n=1 Tax=Planoprotostelium fungivorum TaxID=1890364 RepID=A0A2P6NWI0_9EUKA|nr:hypothetical protein PROFUN_03424 [Planoprotostelium fungivorum]
MAWGQWNQHQLLLSRGKMRACTPLYVQSASRTIFLIDASQDLSDPNPDVEPSLVTLFGSDCISLNKTKAHQYVEAARTYARSIIQLCGTEQSQVSVMSMGDNLIVHNTWQQQSIKTLLQNTKNVVLSSESNRPDMVEEAVNLLLEDMTVKDVHTRIILLSSGILPDNESSRFLMSSTVISSIVSSVLDKVNGKRMVPITCELILLCTTSSTTPSTTVSTPKDVMSHVTSLLARDYNINHLTLKNVPVAQATERGISQKEISIIYKEPYNIRPSPRKLVWQVVDRGLRIEDVAVSRVAHVIPLKTDTLSVVLFQFVSSGRSRDYSTMSHEISQVYLHVVDRDIEYVDWSVFHRGAAQISSARFPRSADFYELVQENVLRLSSQPELMEPVIKCGNLFSTKSVDKKTRYFPQAETMLLGRAGVAVELKEMLDVIKTTLNLDEISPDRTDDIVKIAAKLHRAYSLNDPLFFPQLMNSSSDRLEAYQKLMSDLAQYGRSFGDISSHHSRIARALEQSEGTIIEEHNVTQPIPRPMQMEIADINYVPPSVYNGTVELYTGMKIAAPPDPTDPYAIMEAAEKEFEKQAWLKADASQKAVMDMEKRRDKKEGRDRTKRRKETVHDVIERSSPHSLFSVYWKQQTMKKIPTEFEARSDANGAPSLQT